MGGEWRRYEVADLISDDVLYIGDGYRAKNAELSTSGLPFARAGNINDGFRFDDADHFPEADLHKVGNKISQPGDVVFTSKGTVGRFAFVRPGAPRFVYSPQLCFWRSLDRAVIEPRFLFYWMLGREFHVQFKGVAGQTDMAEYVSLTDQRQMHLTLPPISEQRAIAHILGTLDDKIELNRRMNETLEAMARALFKSWFVDFDPVRAKMEGRDTGLPGHIAELFPDRLVDSELGEIPEGWSGARLADLALLNPETWSRASRPSSIDYVDLSNTKWGRIETSTLYLRNSAPSRAQRVLRVGDTIVGTVRPENGSYALISQDGLTGSTAFAVLRPRVPQDAEFIYLAATSSASIMELACLADGGAYPAVRPDVVSGIRVARPHESVALCFRQIVVPCLQKMAHNNRQTAMLASVRDNLLPGLVSGAIRVHMPGNSEPMR